ncbi:bifunctional tRNA (5-methylaminomethyl-2-thiouridine)(34)-methyltransferase MnmD/FAD-dependent 5-carboxymethylaminomethyl-2-thiouridine(34) oxidoreductase MnmC [Halomonas vilamensis]|uniref:tRNA 5-methylaminomethyl-2-thiouridine biosynthesis bifunctional protein MnmC n=1 Tax=Vreelandella vilamensis TaxID=531309 RepID=A0ABU1H4C6_9GAMM|nr:bifunctional tRNA (5-methylaminomethyl-2-thiouridine)(34)-methyltransferase MnmD/FAD-dependent 5-carboxymethylaminomethyl-2-thiouridine(34) oxidoreductase MnmC [Halomonas vilamensis]MDR5899159.1 bifunctional tRNA (5-methylaminomethyl-2-thiouridine)(34)-methyltransferase MnmD/FAD-dependent 5-carboxymethylaminomethyl-2-thiouridine(34) oxidoreductase MnmC [Halomonas vilamensis]
MTQSTGPSCFPPLPALSALTPPELRWENGAPHSQAFDDVYFSREDGHAETEHVFIHANRLPERFANWREARAFVIGETGFGTGLNMLCAWACFERHAPATARLHLLSTEKYPLPRQALAKALSAWPSLEGYAQPLRSQWPDAVSGIHRLHLSERVTLDVHFGDTAERLALLDGQVDAWFLDGFAPSKNPEMWQPSLFHAMAARSRPGATFATFTCAGVVKRGLKAAGFRWQKVSGFGRKREMLAGHIGTPPADTRRRQTPWFTPPPPQPVKHVVVIGAGIAGSSVASALARRGVAVTVVDKTTPAAGGSGNHQGALYVKLAAETNAQSRVYLSGLMYSRRWLKWLDPARTLWGESGVLQLALSDKEAQRQRRFFANHPLPASLLTLHPRGELNALAGLPVAGEQGLFYPQAGWVRPQKLCERLLTTPGVHYQQGEVTQLHQRNNGWQLTMASGDLLAADQVVIASAHLANGFTQTRALPLQAVRGQVSSVPLPANVTGPKPVICAGGYVPPALAGILTFGASFVPNSETTGVFPEEHQRNLDELRQSVPALADALENAGLSAEDFEGRAAVRAASPDKSPYAGPVPNADAWQADYAVLGKDASRVPTQTGQHHSGLWISAAHGSRGLASAPLCAEVIASRMCDEPLPLEAPLADHLHPGRRIISALIRRQVL